MNSGAKITFYSKGNDAFYFISFYDDNTAITSAMRCVYNTVHGVTCLFSVFVTFLHIIDYEREIFEVTRHELGKLYASAN